MSEIIFIYEGQNIKIQCDKSQKMKDICNILCAKLNLDINLLDFSYEGKQVNLENKLDEITSENNITIYAFKSEKANLCSNCEKILDDILIINNNTNNTLMGIKSSIEQIMNDIKNKKDINYINNHLNNINIIINNLNEDIKKMNIRINKVKYNPKNNDNIKLTDGGEINCIYNKRDDEINLLHDFSLNTDDMEFGVREREAYLEAKKIMNEKFIDIYINNKKIKFNFKYKSKEIGDIKVKFILKKPLITTSNMFRECSSLASIDLSLFNSININNTSWMFNQCSSLEEINFSSFNTSKVKDMNAMFFGCSSLESLDLCSFDTTKVKNMNWMFQSCSSLKSLDLSSFNTSNVEAMAGMFNGCFALKRIDLTSFDTTNVKVMTWMFQACSSLKLLDLSSFNTINVKNMKYMFNACSSLISLDLSSFNTNHVMCMTGMFWQCASLKSLDLSSFKTNFTEMDKIFEKCPSLKKENVKINDSEKNLLAELEKCIKI